MTKIHIVLPNRLGDSILTLPALLCLKQLLARHRNNCYEVTLLSHFPLHRYLEALNLFNVRHLNVWSKITSWTRSPDKVYFLSTTSKNIGYHAKCIYGLRLPNKRYSQYDVNLPYLHLSHPEAELPGNLAHFLQTSYSLPPYAARHFGICLEFGFSVEQVKECFTFDHSSLLPTREYFDSNQLIPGPYVVFCMEAAYNRKHAANRRWDEQNFLSLADRIFEDLGIRSVFIGLQSSPPIPHKNYLQDLRKKLSLEQTLQLLKQSQGYIGNDTGPLHLANLVRKNSVALYPPDGSIAYRPLFPTFNTVCINTQSPENVYPLLERLLREKP